MTENPEDQNLAEQPAEEDAGSNDNQGLKISAIIIAVVAALILIVLGVMAVSGYFNQPEPTPVPPQAATFITITEPTQNAVLDITSGVTVKGQGGGLFEGNVVVQALDAAGNVLAQQPTTIDAPDAGTGGAGPWSVELSIDADPGTTGQIYAFSTSPESGETVASAKAEVVFGETAPVDVFIKITKPKNGATLALDKAITMTGEGGGLFEGNVVVQALDAAGNVLAQQPTIIDAPDAGTGGAGPWSVELTIPSSSVAPGTPGKITAISPSPVDGSNMAADSVDVTLGEAPQEAEKVKLEDHLWVLASLNGQAVIGNSLVTLGFENNQAAGSGGCNNYSASFERTRTDLTFGPVSATERACEMPDGVMDQETTYLRTLEQAATFKVEDKQLKVFSASGDTILVYFAAVVGQVIGPGGAEFPEGAVVTIRLSDVSLADVEAKVIGEQVISGATQFPILFAVTYDPEEIQENNTYGIGVRIEDNAGTLLYINTTAYNVITRGNPSQVEVMVEAVQ